MAAKDITEKLLEDYNEVFADIVNVILFDGEQIVDKNDLRAKTPISQYKVDQDKLHEQERDVLKEWVSGNVEIAICGLENQTKAEKLMPLRVIGYDGSAYRMQLLDKNRKKYVPVITIVLHFGNDRWNQPKTLKGVIDIPVKLDGYVNDYRINVVDVAFLSEEQLEMFTSDFKIIAKFFVSRRKNKDYVPDDPTVIRHVDEVLKLLSVMTGDHRYEEILKDSKNESGVHTMCDVAERLETKGRMEGRIEGRMEGRIEGIAEKALQVYNNCIDRGMSKEDAVAISGYNPKAVKTAE